MTKEQLINEAKRIGFYTDEMKKVKPTKKTGERAKNSEKDQILALMKAKLDSDVKINAHEVLERIGITSAADIAESMKSLKKLEDVSTYTNYIDNFIRIGFIVISPNVMKIIENPNKLFLNYNRYGVVFEEDGSVQFIPKYNTGGPITPNTVETIYEILKNMSYTTNFGFNSEIMKYINDMSLFDKLNNQDKLKIMAKFPIIKIVIKIKQKGLKITIWNILTTAYDMWYPKLYRGMKKELVDDIKSKTLKYTFENPIEITVLDAINYFGDSYYQNARYTKGVTYEMIANKYTGNVLYLNPGCRFIKINPEEVTFTDKTSSVAKYSQNPYVTLFRNIDDKDPRISIEMLVVGEELHSSKMAVSSHLARRHGMIYNVDMSNVNPCFSIPDPNISGKFREIAITGEDVDKFLAKGGNYYTILEMPDARTPNSENYQLVIKQQQ